VDELDDLLLRLNLCRATTVRIDFEPELPSIPARLFESLFIPGLQVLQFEQPLPFDAVPALAAFVRGDPGRDLQTICINRLRLTEEAIQNLVQGLMQAQVPYIGYRFQKDGPGLEIDLGLHKPGHSGRPRRGSTGSVVVVPRY
jgi:hypothetical protein